MSLANFNDRPLSCYFETNIGFVYAYICQLSSVGSIEDFLLKCYKKDLLQYSINNEGKNEKEVESFFKYEICKKDNNIPIKHISANRVASQLKKLKLHSNISLFKKLQINTIYKAMRYDDFTIFVSNDRIYCLEFS